MNLLTTEKVKKLVTSFLWNKYRSIQELNELIEDIETQRRAVKGFYDDGLFKIVGIVFDNKHHHPSHTINSMHEYQLLHSILSEVYFVLMQEKTKLIEKLNNEHKPR